MDKSLREHLKHADDIHDYIDKFCIMLTSKQLEEKIINLQSSIKILQSISKRIADVSNIATRILNHKKNNKRKDEKKFIDPYPTSEDHTTVRTLYSKESKQIIDDLYITIKIVDKASDIPISNVYYITELKQYAININGVILKGNLGDITHYKDKFTNRCEYGIKCKSFDKNIRCQYYHDPEDYIKNGKEVPDIERNFTAGSWIYSRTKTPKTYFCRHIGSKSRLTYDLQTLKKVQYIEEISNREGQLIHDLLIYMILNSKGLLERYPHWVIEK